MNYQGCLAATTWLFSFLFDIASVGINGASTVLPHLADFFVQDATANICWKMCWAGCSDLNCMCWGLLCVPWQSIYRALSLWTNVEPVILASSLPVSILNESLTMWQLFHHGIHLVFLQDQFKGSRFGVNQSKSCLDPKELLELLQSRDYDR